MYEGKNGETYGGLEESILACLLISPQYMESLIVDERHFKKYSYILTFFKEFYLEYHNLDITIMFSVVKDSSQIQLLDAITYLSEIFVIPTHCMEYQKRLLDMYVKSKKEDWLRKKIYEKATMLFVGRMSLNSFNEAVNKLYEKADSIEWK